LPQKAPNLVTESHPDSGLLLGLRKAYTSTPPSKQKQKQQQDYV
jgi:hypothetical protein